LRAVGHVIKHAACSLLFVVHATVRAAAPKEAATRRLTAMLILALLAGSLSAWIVLEMQRPASNIRILPLAVFPLAMAFDPASGHLVVVGYRESSQSFWVSTLDRAGRTLRTVRIPLRAWGARCCTPTLALDSPHEQAFVGSAGSNQLAVIDARNGTLLHMIPVHGSISLDLDPHGNRLFVWGSAIDVLDTNTDAVIRTVPVSQENNTVIAGQGIAVDDQTGHLFAAMGDGQGLLMLDTIGGRPIGHTEPMGRYPAADAMYAQTVVADGRGHIIAGDRATGAVSIFSARNGKRLRTLHVDPDPMIIAVDGARDRLLVVGLGGVLHILRLHDGFLIKNIAVAGHGLTMALDQRRARAYLVTFDGSATYGVSNGPGLIQEVDVTQGRALRQFATGVVPTQIAVDEATGRLYIGSTGGPVLVQHDSWSWLPGWLRRVLPSTRTSRTSIVTEPPEIMVVDGTWRAPR
jgi:DNA-binding beta-propeller fold protein YncE